MLQKIDRIDHFYIYNLKMSKANKLLANIETNIKIERGLKVLEFATEYYLTRSYLRSTPLNYNLNKKTTLKQQQEYAEIIAQLNYQILQPKTTDLKVSIDKINISHSKIKEKLPERSPITIMVDSKSKEDKKTIFQQVDSLGSSMELPQNSNIPNITEQKSGKTQSKVKKTKVQGIPIQPPTSHKKGNKVGFVEISKNNHSNSISQEASSELKSQSINSSLDLNSEDFMSYHSESRSMKVIQQASESQQNSSHLKSLKYNGKKGKSSQMEGFSIQQFNSINHGKISIGNSTVIPKKIEPTKKGIQKSMQTSNILLSESIKIQKQKSEKLSFLNRSITEIQQSDSKSFILGSELNNTQKSLLKQISESFVQNQKIKTLMKLQNLQLQQKYLLQRMEKRFQMCVDEINQIRTLKWQNLNLPKGDISFRRPNYAHCIE